MKAILYYLETSDNNPMDKTNANSLVTLPLTKRILALLIDFLIMIVPCAIVWFLLSVYLMGGIYQEHAGSLAWSVVFVAYYGYYESTQAASIGLKRMGGVIINGNGKPLSFQELFCRNLLWFSSSLWTLWGVSFGSEYVRANPNFSYFLSIGLISFCFLNVAAILFNKERKSLVDYLGETRVVEEYSVSSSFEEVTGEIKVSEAIQGDTKSDITRPHESKPHTYPMSPKNGSNSLTRPSVKSMGDTPTVTGFSPNDAKGELNTGNGSNTSVDSIAKEWADSIYKRVADEMEEGRFDKGLLLRVKTENIGSPHIDALYAKQRVLDLMDVQIANAEEKRQENIEDESEFPSSHELCEITSLFDKWALARHARDGEASPQFPGQGVKDDPVILLSKKASGLIHLQQLWLMSKFGNEKTTSSDGWRIVSEKIYDDRSRHLAAVEIQVKDGRKGVAYFDITNGQSWAQKLDESSLEQFEGALDLLERRVAGLQKNAVSTINSVYPHVASMAKRGVAQAISVIDRYQSVDLRNWS